MVTECGIPPGATYTYRIPLQQTGTYWIHSHYKLQTADWLRTSLIIRDPDKVYAYDKEIVLLLEDWFREPASELMKQFRSPDPDVRFQPVVPYGIIGGDCASRKHLHFAPDCTCCIRLLNIGAAFDYHLSIDGHMLRIIEVDGVLTKKRATHGVTVAVGQRTFVLVTAHNTTDLNYAFHADMYTDLLQMPRYNPLNFIGTVEYAPGARLKRERCIKWMCLHDLDLEPLDEEPLLEPDTHVTLDAYSGVFNDQAFHHSFNNRTYVSPRAPTALTALTLGEDAMDAAVYGHQTSTHVLKYMDVVEVLVNNHDYYSHPFHLHGHVFQSIETGSIRHNDRSSKMSLNNPVKRDTVVIHGGHYAILHFRVDNPVVWLFHCHIDFHIMLGLQMTFVEAPDRIQQLHGQVLGMLRENCVAQGIKTSGNTFSNRGLVDCEEDQELPSLYPDQFESADPPSGWQMISYIIHGNS
ncbi:ferroxidase fet3 [Coemansia sp. RSA 552]|nr:ferroxidase fet3 [Coemansia sp. RSA 552]